MKNAFFEAPHKEIKCVLSIKETNFNDKNVTKFSHLIMVRAKGADLPPPPLQSDRKKTVFLLTISLSVFVVL